MKFRIASLLTVLVALPAIATACSGIGAFSFTEESEPIVIEASPLPFSDLFPAQIPMEMNLEQELEEQDASGARSVTLTELYFETTDDTEQDNFDFVDEVTIEISSQQSDSDLPDETLAWLDDVPEGESTIFLEVDDEIDLKPYAEEGLRMNTDASGSAPSQDVEFKVFAKFRVDVI